MVVHYPNITDLDQAQRAIAGRKEFVQQESNGFVFIKYKSPLSDTFPDPSKALTEDEKFNLEVRRECRGIGFNKETGKIVTRKFHKFFNLNEVEESRIDKIDFDRPFIVLEKLDGQLVSPVKSLTDGSILYTTMMGVTPISDNIRQFVNSRTNELYDALSSHCIEKGLSPLFEYMSVVSPIVINYDQEQLTLIALRNTITGQYVDHNDVVALSHEYNVPIVRTWSDIPSEINALSKHVQGIKLVEGCVIKFKDGDLYKCKTEWYFKKKNFNPKKIGSLQVWRSVVENTIDDLLQVLEQQPDLKEKLYLLTSTMRQALSDKIEKIKTLKNDQLLNINITDGQDVDLVVKDAFKNILKNYESYQLFEKPLLEWLNVDHDAILNPYHYGQKGYIRKLQQQKKIDSSSPSLVFKSFNKNEYLSSVGIGAGHSQADQKNALKSNIINDIPGLIDHIDNIISMDSKVRILDYAQDIKVINVDNTPCFFKIKDTPYFPTIFILSKHANLYPIMQTDKGAVKFVLKGANIMCPGLTTPGANIDMSVGAGCLVTITGEGEQEPLAIGFTTMSSQEIMEVNKGVGIMVVHYRGDKLHKEIVNSLKPTKQRKQIK
ncbi:hypothetical protein AKO1_014431 [Acrasis kona]|uniref:PUA domain-containing protein n=1 Tax=Acrasis kona TaxID=1008807 RepID=A0AAW2YYI7_9EUKA